VIHSSIAAREAISCALWAIPKFLVAGSLLALGLGIVAVEFTAKAIKG
jgi:hypothetical protein